MMNNKLLHNLGSRRSFRMVACLTIVMLTVAFEVSAKPRARDLGIPFDGEPGPFNAITDVPGVEVGQVTLIKGEGELKIGTGPVRTGATAILPIGKTWRPVFAAWHAFNRNGELTGTAWVEESGLSRRARSPDQYPQRGCGA